MRNVLWRRGQVKVRHTIFYPKGYKIFFNLNCTEYKMDSEQLHADIMERCFESIERGELPSDEDLLMFHYKGVRLLTAANLWNGLDADLTIEDGYFYPIRNIKDCLIINHKDDVVLPKKQGKGKRVLPKKQGEDKGETKDI